MTRMLLIGWDAADWKVINPLIARGEMPNLARLMQSGVHGNHATLYPPLSPMLWTSIATGKRPTKHGIHGFTEPTEDGLALRPVSNLGRKTKALWNILNQNGKRCIVVGWWPSHPAEPINDVMVSNHFPFSTSDQPTKPLAPRTISPPERASDLAELRVHPTEITGEILNLFIPDAAQIDQEKDKSLHDLAGIIAETMSIHTVATELMETDSWDLAAIYFAGIDHFSHRFMGYHAGKRRGGPNSADPSLLQHVITGAYRYHDLMLGRLIQLAGPDCTVMVISDHGFHSDRLLPDHIPAEAAGPAVEHRDFGIVCLSGPEIRQGERIYGANVLDVTPTVLHIFGLPAGADMDGKVLINAFHVQSLLPRIPSWDDVPGEHGRHAPETQFDATESVEALKQLVDLGYVAPPGDDAGTAVRECMAERHYNLARSHMDAGDMTSAAALFQELIAEDAEQIRYYQHLFRCLMAMGRYRQCERMLAKLDESCPDIARRAQTELKCRQDADKDAGERKEHERRREMFERRALFEKATGFVGERMFMRCSLLLSRRNAPDQERARTLLDQLASRRRTRASLSLFLAEGYAQLREDEKALEFVRATLRRDRDNWGALTLEARLHFRAKYWQDAADAAIKSLSLVYLQPGLHRLLGLALLRMGDIAGAERELRVAVAQAPMMVAAHESLAAVLRRDPARLGEASVHMAHAELIRSRRKRIAAPADAGAAPAAPSIITRSTAVPADPSRVITVVSGLPRSGTSMMMQMLAAGGIAVFTDSAREADENNPHGYFEHAKTLALHADSSWLGQARGKAVKIVAPLLSHLPQSETYRIIFMRRDLQQVIGSQRAMLARLQKEGARLSDGALMRAYTGQLVRAQAWLERQSNIPVLSVAYDDAVADPINTAERLASFLGGRLDAQAAARAIDAALRHQEPARAAS